MFLQFKKINNESGVVFLIVLMTAIIIIIYSLGLLTQSMNETGYAQQQIDQIASEQLSTGIFWNSYASGSLSASTCSVIDGRNYATTLSSTAGLFGAGSNWQVNTNYDTF